MSLYDQATMELAKEIAEHAGSSLDSDVDFIADWLVNGGDDGSQATELYLKFDSKHTLPSQK